MDYTLWDDDELFDFLIELEQSNDIEDILKASLVKDELIFRGVLTREGEES